MSMNKQQTKRWIEKLDDGMLKSWLCGLVWSDRLKQANIARRNRVAINRIRG